MYFLDTLIIPIFATAFSFLGQASQVADKCLQGCQNKALLSPDNINCPVDEISACSCNWTPLRDISFCCLVNSCLLSPEDAVDQWAVDCAIIGVPMPPFSIELLCSETGNGFSSTFYSLSNPVDFISIITTQPFITLIKDPLTSSITEFTIPLPTISQVTAPETILVSTFYSKVSTNISTPSPPSPTTAVPATAPQTSPSNPQKTTAGDSPAKDEKKKLGIILGLSVPAAILLALAAIFFWIRRLKSKKRMAAAEVRDREDEPKASGMSKERLSDIPKEGGYNKNNNKEKAGRFSELHSDPIPPYSTELPGTPAPKLIELPA